MLDSKVLLRIDQTIVLVFNAIIELKALIDNIFS